MRIHAVAYVKAVCHASKHSFGTVNGVLLGIVHEAEGEVEVVDAMPMLHQHTTLTMLSQVALTQADAYAKEKDLQVVGYYHAPARASECELTGTGAQLADKIQSKCKNAVVLVGNFSKLGHTDMSECRLFEPFAKRGDAQWKQRDEEVTFLPTEELAFQTAADMVEAGEHVALVDFDDHVTEVSADWLNEDFSSAIKKRLLPAAHK